MSRMEFIKNQLEKYPRIPSVDIGIPPWVRIGYDVDIHSSAVIGETGFGITTINNRNVLIPHIGGVSIGDYSIILANTHIARATAKDCFTILENNVCVDALVHIGHNAHIGMGTKIVAGTVVGGSVKIGKFVDIGMNVSIKDHIIIADKVLLGAGAIVVKNCLKENWIYANKMSSSGLVYAHPIRERTPEDVL